MRTNLKFGSVTFQILSLLSSSSRNTGANARNRVVRNWPITVKCDTHSTINH